MSRKLFILSPHYDDALLSCGQHILEWKKIYDVIVISIFTSFSSKHLPTYSQKILKKYNLTAQKYEQIRSLEDTTAFQKIGIKTISLGLIDGGFRSAHSLPVYDSPEKLFSNNIAPEDQELLLKLETIWRKIISPSDIVVAPLGIGKHTDHYLVVESLKNLQNITTWKYLDFPYALHFLNYSLQHILAILTHQKSIRWTSTYKKKILSVYTTQIPLLFKKKIPSYPEIILQ